MSFLASRKGRLSLVGSSFIFSLMASDALSATQGDISDTGSVGTSAISVTIPKMVVVTGLQDITVAGNDVVTALAADPPTDITASSNACVAGNGSFTYAVTVASANPDASNAPRLTDGTNFLEYAVTWGGTNTLSGQTLPTQTLDQQNLSNTCTDTGKIGITIDSAKLLAATNGGYNDTLTVTVSPE